MLLNNPENKNARRAVEKLDAEYMKKNTLGFAADIVRQPVYDALKQFCIQSEAFAEAVTASEKTLNDCCVKITEGVRQGHAAAVDIYGKAAEFYFPGAHIECAMTIYTATDGKTPAGKSAEPVILNLMDLL